MCSFEDEFPEGSGLEICPTPGSSVIFQIEGHFQEQTETLLTLVIIFVTAFFIGLFCLFALILIQWMTNHRQVNKSFCITKAIDTFSGGGV